MYGRLQRPVLWYKGRSSSLGCSKRNREEKRLERKRMGYTCMPLCLS